MKINVDAAAALADGALAALGYSATERTVIAGHLLDCELRGLEYSGLARIISIADRRAARPSAPAAMRITRESPVSAQLDGGDQLGYLVSQEATRIAIAKANAVGIGVVGASNTWYTGMLSYYAEQIVAAGLVGVLASNTTPWVAPFGGTEPRFGTNPICVGFPSDGVPVIWDIGTAEIIHAQAVIADRTGQQLPPGVAYDLDGAETRDPVAALSGAFASWGGHRGSGLGIVVQLLGLLAGSPISPGELRDFGFFVLALQPELFVDASEFRTNVSTYAEIIRSTRRLDPDQPVRMPFERSAALRAQRLASGSIELPDVVYEAVVRLAEGKARD